MARVLRGFGVSLAFFCVALGGAARVRAEPSPLAACVARLDDARVAQLLQLTEQSLADQRLGASLWFAGWSAFNLANVSIGAWRIAVAEQQVQRDGWMLAAIGAGGFVIGTALMPPPALYASRRLSRMSAASPAQRREKLRRGLALLESAADFETRNTSLLIHIGGALYGALSLGYMYWHNRNADDMRAVHILSWVQAGATVVGGEATIWSVPRRARRDVAYVRRYACPEPRGRVPRVLSLHDLTIQVAGPYAGVRLRF